MIDFTPKLGVNYRYNYEQIFSDIANGALDEVGTYHQLCLTDLFFIVYFVMQIKIANHAFVVDACREVEDGPDSNTLDIWARGHFKSSIITTAEVIQTILRNPEERIGIFSHTRPNAKAFLREIKHVFERSMLLKKVFPDIVWENCSKEAPKWSEDDGLILKRGGYYKESSIEAWGLIEGMPTGKHFTRMYYDDIVTDDLVTNPDIMHKIKETFDLSLSLGTYEGSKHRVVGTFYHHDDPYTYIKSKKNSKGEAVYHTRIKPLTVDGTINGAPVFFTQDVVDEIKNRDPYIVNCQYLCNPTPIGTRPLSSSSLIEVKASDVPVDVDTFMLIDPAGDNSTGSKHNDAWAMIVVAIDPNNEDNYGMSDVYIVDAYITQTSEESAIDNALRMYLRAGVVNALCIEKSGQSAFASHMIKALEKKGRFVSEADKSLIILSPAGRKKEVRLSRALGWPLQNGKIHISSSVPAIYAQRLKDELDKFPSWHDDGIDALAYLYDVIPDYPFTSRDTIARLRIMAKQAWNPTDSTAGY